MKKATKGEYGYFANERKRRLILTLLFAANGISKAIRGDSII